MKIQYVSDILQVRNYLNILHLSFQIPLFCAALRNIYNYKISLNIMKINNTIIYLSILYGKISSIYFRAPVTHFREIL